MTNDTGDDVADEGNSTEARGPARRVDLPTWPDGDDTETESDGRDGSTDGALSAGGSATDRVGDRVGTGPLSRRRFLGAAAAAGAIAIGGTAPASAAKVQEICNSDYGKIQVTDDFTVMDNRWGMKSATQCVWLNDDGTYGYNFDASDDSGGINYPEVYIGTRPWGDDTGVPEFPVQRQNVDELVMEVEANYNISGGEWDWAEEWWLMEQPPSQQTETHQYEVMLLLDWGGGHDHGAIQDQNAWTDQFGNTVSLWTTYNSGGTSATFYIFRIEGGHDGGKIDMKQIVDYLSANEGIAGDLYLSGIELGNEYWAGAVGETTYNTFDVTVNGSTYTSGGSGGGGGGTSDTTAPTAPSNLSSPSQGTNSVDLDWGASSDSGSGIDHYNVYRNGSQVQQVAAGTTATTVSNLSSGTSYDFSVTAVDGAGNESSSSNTITVSTDSTTSGQSPYGGSAHAIPGTIEAEDFDTGGQGVAYNDTTSGNDGGAYRSTDVDIESSTEHGYNVGWVATGEWWEYTVNVDSDGAYDVTARVASASGGGSFHVEVDGTDLTGTVSFAGTGGWQTWTTVSAGSVNLTAGEHVVRVYADSGSWNLNYLDFASGSGTGDSTAPTAPSNLSSPAHGTSSVDLDWSGSSDSGGSGLSHYNVYVNGAKNHETAAGTTSTTVSNLSSGTSYDFEVTAVDGAGNESSPSNTISVTTDSSADTTAPTAPSNLASPSSGSSSVDLDWSGSSDSGGSGLSHYNVYVDGSVDHTVVASSTSTTVSGLSASTSYSFSVTAVDGAGNESSSSNTVSVTTDSSGGGGDDGGSTGGLTVNDYDGSPAWPGSNDLGNWEGAGSFDSSGVVSGALRLEYSGAGWFQSYVQTDVSSYSTLNLRVRGDSGGEESDFAVQLGDSGGVLGNLTSDTIGTSFSTVSIDLAANGMDASTPDDVYFDFWQGSSGSSAIEVDRIWFE